MILQRLWRNWAPAMLVAVSVLGALGAPKPKPRPAGEPAPEIDAIARAEAATVVDLAAVSRSLEAQGYECGPVTATDGLTCTGRVGAYPREVALIVPPGYRPGPRADWVLHLHGHNAGHATLASLLARHRYTRMLAQSGRNALLLAPWSDGNCVDFELSLADGASFGAFFEAATAAAARAGLVTGTRSAIGTITLSGHSGSYRALATMIGNGMLSDHLRELLLIEASYGRTEEFARFAASPGHRFWSVYRSDDPDMSVVNPAIMGELARLGVTHFAAGPQGFGADDVAAHRVGFAPSQVDHESAVRRYWGVLLGAPAPLELE